MERVQQLGDARRGKLAGKIVMISQPGTGSEPTEPAFRRFQHAFAHVEFARPRLEFLAALLQPLQHNCNNRFHTLPHSLPSAMPRGVTNSGYTGLMISRPSTFSKTLSLSLKLTAPPTI